VADAVIEARNRDKIIEQGTKAPAVHFFTHGTDAWKSGVLKRLYCETQVVELAVIPVQTLRNAAGEHEQFPSVACLLSTAPAPCAFALGRV
jgi:hypothetical protein